MQSEDYVPGVSGWKISKNLIQLNGGPCGVVTIGNLDNLDEPQTGANEQTHSPFIVADRFTYISDAHVADAVLKRAAEDIACNFSVKVEQQPGGHYFAAGIDLGEPKHWPEIVVKPEHIEFLPDGYVRIKQKKD